MLMTLQLLQVLVHQLPANRMEEKVKTRLLTQIKRNLTITWDDEDTNQLLEDALTSSVSYLTRLGGIKLLFEEGSAEEELVCERVRYIYNNALADFEENFSSPLAAFIQDCALTYHYQEEGEDGKEKL